MAAPSCSFALLSGRSGQSPQATTLFMKRFTSPAELEVYPGVAGNAVTHPSRCGTRPRVGQVCPCRGSSGWPSARTTSSSLGLFLLTLHIFALSPSAPFPLLAEPFLEGFITQPGHSI